MFNLINFVLISLITFSVSHAMQPPGPPQGINDEGKSWKFNNGEIADGGKVGGLKISNAVIIDRVSFIFEQMLSDPSRLIDNCHNCLMQFFDGDISFSEAEESNPICALNECHSATCPYTRSKNVLNCPRNQAIKLILENAIPARKEITVASYASGELFFDLQLLVHLSKLGVKVGKFIFIDPIYSDLIELGQTLGKQEHENLIQMLQQSNKHNPKIIQQLIIFKQFFSVANTLYGKTVEIFLFENAAAYGYASQDSITADLCFAFDFIDANRDCSEYDFDFELITKAKLNPDGKLIVMFLQEISNNRQYIRANIYRPNANTFLMEQKKSQELTSQKNK